MSGRQHTSEQHALFTQQIAYMHVYTLTHAHSPDPQASRNPTQPMEVAPGSHPGHDRRATLLERRPQAVETSASARRRGGKIRGTPVVIAILCDIAHPGQGLVTALLDDFEVSDLNSRHSEIWNFVFDRDGCSLIRFRF